MHRKWWTLLVVSVATFMLLLDITVVNTALPAIEQDLGASFTELQWVIDAYALTLAAFVLTAGSLADRLGRRRLFTAGLVVFIVSSLAAGLAGDPTTLNVSRAVQGIGGAVMFAVSLALITQEFAAGRERGAAMGAYGATIGVAVAVGPLVGGAITEWVGWEWVFFLNVPIGLLALMITALQVRESRDPNATRIDWAGQAAFSGALLFLVLALLRGNSEGWGSTGIIAMFATAAALMAAFIAIERRVREPMLPLGLFRIRSFTGVQIAAFGVSGSLFALFLYLTLYLQNFLGLSPLEAGLRYLPLTLISFFTAAAAGAMLSRIQARYLLGAGLLGVGIGLLLMGGIAVDSEWTTLLGGFVVAGAGVGLLNPVVADVAVSVVPKEQSGMAAGINDTFRQVGIAVGIALWGALFIGRGEGEITELGATAATTDGPPPKELIEAASSGNLDRILEGVPPSAGDSLRQATDAAFVSALNEILLLGGLLAFAGAVLSTWLVREDEIEREQPGGQPAPAEVGAATEPAQA
jgi:EmrB/QacA subfamily drug resistance transporter